MRTSRAPKIFRGGSVMSHAPPVAIRKEHALNAAQSRKVISPVTMGSVVFMREALLTQSHGHWRLAHTCNQDFQIS